MPVRRRSVRSQKKSNRKLRGISHRKLRGGAEGPEGPEVTILLEILNSQINRGKNVLQVIEHLENEMRDRGTPRYIDGDTFRVAGHPPDKPITKNSTGTFIFSTREDTPINKNFGRVFILIFDETFNNLGGEPPGVNLSSVKYLKNPLSQTLINSPSDLEAILFPRSTDYGQHTHLRHLYADGLWSAPGIHDTAEKFDLKISRDALGPDKPDFANY
jgi:hypothetical protein